MTVMCLHLSNLFKGRISLVLRNRIFIVTVNEIINGEKVTWISLSKYTGNFTYQRND